MNKIPIPAKNQARKLQNTPEKVMFDGPAQRADIIKPGKDKSYGDSSKGGIATRQEKKRPPQKPTTKSKPAPKKIKQQSLSPAQQNQKLAEDVILSFTYNLIDEARARGGYLSVNNLKKLSQDFQKKTAELKVAFEKTFDDFVAGQRQQTWVNSRMRPFDRIIVKTFSHLLEKNDHSVNPSNHASRHMLPGFFIALNLMLGADVMESYQGKCRAIVKLAGQKNSDDFDWDSIYANDVARALSFDALVEIARHFSNFDKRRDWFIDLVNTHLPPIAPVLDDENESWLLTPQGFDEFFEALMSELRVAISMDAGRALVTRRHSAETAAEVTKLMKKLSPPQKVS